MRTRAPSYLHLFILISLFLITFSHIQAQHQLIRKVYDTKTNTWVQVTCLYSKLPSHGYVPIRVEMNNGTEKNHSYSIDFTSESSSSYYGETGSQLSSTFDFSCAAGERETYDFIVPITTIFQSSSYHQSNNLEMKLNCSSYSLITSSMSSDQSSDWPAIIASKALYVPNASSISSIAGGSSSYSNLDFAGSFDPKNMPTDWRGYMGQEIIMLTSNDWTALDPGSRTAILDWNRLGGRLLIYTSNSSDTFASLQIKGDPLPALSTSLCSLKQASVTSYLSLPLLSHLVPAPSSSSSFYSKTALAVEDTA